MTLMEILGEENVDPELCALLMGCSLNPADRLAKLVAADWAQEHATLQGMKSLEYLLRFLADDPNPILFTGSRCYGIPRPNSDFDWVWRWHDGLLWELKEHAGARTSPEERERAYDTRLLSWALRFGPVNLLVVTRDEQQKVWAEATSILSDSMRKWKRRWTRAEAIAVIETIEREVYGLAEELP